MTARATGKWGARALGLALGWAASVAYACPVCFSAKDEAQRQAFFDTTVFLTLLPIAMIGGIIYWIARRTRQLEAEPTEPEPEAHDAQPGPVAR